MNKKILLAVFCCFTLLCLTACDNINKNDSNNSNTNNESKEEDKNKNTLTCSNTHEYDNHDNIQEYVFAYDKSGKNIESVVYNITAKYKDKEEFKDYVEEVKGTDPCSSVVTEKTKDIIKKCDYKIDEKNKSFIVIAEYDVKNEEVIKHFKLNLSKEELKENVKKEQNIECISN